MSTTIQGSPASGSTGSSCEFQPDHRPAQSHYMVRSRAPNLGQKIMFA